jgi:hypothetical protein
MMASKKKSTTAKDGYREDIGTVEAALRLVQLKLRETNASFPVDRMPTQRQILKYHPDGSLLMAHGVRYHGGLKLFEERMGWLSAGAARAARKLELGQDIDNISEREASTLAPDTAIQGDGGGEAKPGFTPRHPKRAGWPPRLVHAQVVILRRSPDDGALWVLLQKRSTREGGFMPGYLGTVGGKRERTDADSAATALREVWEESGIEVTNGEAALIKFAEGRNVDWFALLFDGGSGRSFEGTNAQSNKRECSAIMAWIPLLQPAGDHAGSGAGGGGNTSEGAGDGSTNETPDGDPARGAPWAAPYGHAWTRAGSIRTTVARFEDPHGPVPFHCKSDGSQVAAVMGGLASKVAAAVAAVETGWLPPATS